MISAFDQADKSGFIPLRRAPYRDFKRKFPGKIRAGAVAFWSEALVRANFEDGYHEGELLRRGQFLFGRDELGKNIGLTVSKVRTIVERLEGLGELTTKSTSRGTVGTIVHYETYVGRVDGFNQPNNQRIASASPLRRS